MTERAFPSCIACGALLPRSWFRMSAAIRPKRWGYSMHFGGRGRISRGKDFLVANYAPGAIQKWLGPAFANQMAAAVAAAAQALVDAGWSLDWILADARMLGRLRWLEAMWARWGQPVAVHTIAQPQWTATVEDHTSRKIDVSPSMRGDAVVEYIGQFGPVTVEEK